MIFKDERELVDFCRRAKLDEWQERLFVKNAEAVKIHSQGQIFYKIDRLFPNEHPESKKHRVLSFGSITEASFGKAASNINRIFKNSSYTVEASEKTLQFAESDIFEGHNLYSWFLDEWTKYALKEDPNTRIVVYPADYEGDRIQFVESELIRHIDDETFIFVSPTESTFSYELKEMQIFEETFFDQSIGKVNSRPLAENTFTPKLVSVVKHPVFHVFQKGVGFYRIEQSKQNPKEFEIELFPFKKKDLFPVTDVGGEKGKNDVNKSFLHPFVAFGNLALLQHSQHCAVNFNFAFPRMSEVEFPCEAQGCLDGYIECETPEDVAKFGEKKKCIVCGGTGGTTRQSPYKVYKKRWDPQTDGEEGRHILSSPDVQFYTPPVEILDYSKNEWKEYLQLAESAVYIQKKIETGNVESHKSKELDRDDFYSFLSKIAQVYFARLRFVLQSIENYEFAKPSLVTVNTPFSLAIVSEGEAFAYLKDIVSSNIPLMIKANQIETFIGKFVSQSSPVRKFIDVLNIVDPLLYYNHNEIQGFKASGIITDVQFANHVFAFHELQKIWNKDKSVFYTRDPGQIAEDLTKALEQYTPERKPDLKETLIGEGLRPPGWKKRSE